MSTMIENAQHIYFELNKGLTSIARVSVGVVKLASQLLNMSKALLNERNSMLKYECPKP